MSFKQTCDDPGVFANYFVEYFESVYSDNCDMLVPNFVYTRTGDITECDVFAALERLTCSKGSGPD